MLVLSRKCGEAIVLGNGITVTVVAVQGGRVKLGIVAPAEVPVHRGEIVDKITHSAPAMHLAECA
jgi:carbon storage regulator